MEHFFLDDNFCSDIEDLARVFDIDEDNVKKCIRLETGVPGVRVFAPKFIEKHKGKPCKGRKCPHWGTTMFEHDSVLVCPMHGLKGDIVKEIIIG